MKKIWNMSDDAMIKMINLSNFLARLQIQTYLKYLYIYVSSSESSSNSIVSLSLISLSLICYKDKKIVEIFSQHLGSFVKCQFIFNDIRVGHISLHAMDDDVQGLQNVHLCSNSYVFFAVLLSTEMTFSSSFFLLFSPTRKKIDFSFVLYGELRLPQG